MVMHTSINEYKTELANEDPHPGERRSTNGLFTGDAGRLVYVDRNGPIRDYSSSMLDKNGIERSRLGIKSAEGVHWFDELETTRQAYHGETTLVVTEHRGPSFSVHQYDYTLEGAHLTHVEFRGDVPERASLIAAMTFAPDRQDRSTGQLKHGDVVEVFHDAEHDYVTASTGLERVVGQSREDFAALLSDEPMAYPSEDDSNEALSDTVVVTAPLDDEGDLSHTTLVSLIADHEETSRSDALAHVRGFADHYPTDTQLRIHATSNREFDVPSVPHRDVIRRDLQTLSLLTGPTGARIKGPEYDPYHMYSGGYGYTWFRDDATIATNLLALENTLDIDLGDAHQRSAAFYERTQLPDGTWPQRVWAYNGSLAPGWANDRITGSGAEFQADATASVLAFLARYLRLGSPEPGQDVTLETTLERAFDALVDLLGDDGLPVTCQSLWEDEVGRFTQTAATFLEAFAAVARAPVETELAERAEEQATALYEAIDSRWLEAGYYARAAGDDRHDVGTLALVSAHRAYAAAVDPVDEQRLVRLVEHVDVTVEGLTRDPDGSAVTGLARYEGDHWRRGEQESEKVWPLASTWVANASAELGVLLADADHEGADAAFARARTHLESVLPDGPLTAAGGFVPEQCFDDGTPDSATPLGWAHGLRLSTIATLTAADALETDAPSASISGPGAHATWTTGETYGIGTACDHGSADPSRVWFTLTEGAMSEPRFPRVDLMNLRTVDFLVVDADADSTYTARTHNEYRTDDAVDTIQRRTEMVGTEGPVYRQRITETGGDHEWELVVEYVADPEAESIVLDVGFTARDGNRYDVYVVGDAALSGYMDGTAASVQSVEDGYALVGSDRGTADDPAVVDESGDSYQVAAALASRRGFDWATVEQAGSEPLENLFTDGAATEGNASIDSGHAVLVGRLGNGVGSLADVVALGFAEAGDTDRALEQSSDSLESSYVDVRERYLEGWQAYLDRFEAPRSVADNPALRDQYRAALMVLKAVEDKTFAGAGIASPCVPWGEAVDATEPQDFGYNFAWARDLYQVFSALRAVGDVESAIDSLEYIYNYQQRVNGFLPQNTYLDGRTRWGGEQLDNIAFPSVMAYQLADHHGVEFDEVSYDYGNVHGSVEYLLRSGPHSGQERWEEEAGFSPSTIAAEIAGLACAAPLADEAGERAHALTYLAHADVWRLGVDDWCATTTGTARHDRTPYYVRVTRDGNPDSGTYRELANNGPTLDERDIIDAGFLELVRLGIRSPDETVIRNSLAVVDEEIRVETPQGPAWYRYNGDGYGELGETEPEEGGPWQVDANGSGRLWPIFTGERAEYELLTADGESPQHLLETMQRFANDGRMIPEQVWDRGYPTDYGWAFGEGTGAATPLAWSMAQYIRLAHGIDAGEPVETPSFIRERYRDGAPAGPSLEIIDVRRSSEGSSRAVNGDDVSGLEASESDGRGSEDQRDDESQSVTIAGETDGDEVVVWTPDGYAATAVETGAFEVTVSLEDGSTEARVVAATEAETLAEVGTALESIDLEAW